MTHRYLLFAGEEYYPTGGWYDYRAGYPTLDEARAAGEDLLDRKIDPPYSSTFEWFHVADCETGRIVAQAGHGHRQPEPGDPDFPTSAAHPPPAETVL